MSFTLGWNRRDEDGKRVKVDFSLVRDKMTWRVKPARHEQWERFDPEAEDWETLFETIERHRARGKVQDPDIRLIKRLKREMEERS